MCATGGLYTVKKVLIFSYFFVFTGLFCTVTAFAYIDPSAMTYIIQLIAGIAIAAGAGAGYYLRRFKRKFSRRGKSGGSSARYYYDEDDDDDTGYGDYELDGTPEAQTSSPAPQPARANAYEAHTPAREPAYAYAAEPVNVPADPFDETGGEGGLAAENRELRRLLAEERQKVEELKRALHICTAPKR